MSTVPTYNQSNAICYVPLGRTLYDTVTAYEHECYKFEFCLETDLDKNNHKYEACVTFGGRRFNTD